MPSSFVKRNDKFVKQSVQNRPYFENIIKQISHVALTTITLVTIITLITSGVEGKLPQKSNSYIAKNDTDVNNKVKNNDSSNTTEEEEEVVDDTPLEKDPHFLVWKILTKLLILTVLRATKRIWSPNYNMIGRCYGYYLMVTLLMWLHICFDVFMEYIATLKIPKYDFKSEYEL